ncbi:MAG: hypothetical protein C4290_15390, partial [Chloroflexota bacterium]
MPEAAPVITAAFPSSRPMGAPPTRCASGAIVATPPLTYHVGYRPTKTATPPPARSTAMLPRVTLRDVLRARRVIRHYLPPTPLIRHPALEELVGTELYVKHENVLPTGAFKVRGGIYLM